MLLNQSISKIKLSKTKSQFAKALTLVYLVLFLAIGALVYFTYSKLEGESLLSMRESSDELIYQINNSLERFIQREEKRTFASYTYTNILTSEGQYKVNSPIASSIDYQNGIIGYFQLHDNKFTSPTLEKFLSYDNKKEREERLDSLINLLHGIKIPEAFIPEDYKEVIQSDLSKLKNSLLGIHTKNKVTSTAKKRKKFNFQELKSIVLRSKKTKKSKKNSHRKKAVTYKEYQENQQSYERGKFIPLLSNDGHILYLRKVFAGNQRFLQGFVVNTQEFFQSLIENEFKSKYISEYAALFIKLGEDSIYNYGFPDKNAKYFVTQSLDYFMNNLKIELIFNKVAKSESMNYLLSIVAILFLVFIISYLFIYKTGLYQFELAEQRSNFVSAVGHELKTPLTSISMYSEMLREGMHIPDEQKVRYYDLIFNEAGRLSRLINNILKLSNISKNSLNVKMETVSLAGIIKSNQSKLYPLIEKAGFKLNISETPECKVELDRDLIQQVFINIIDNSLKFSKDAEKKEIDIFTKKDKEWITISIRDYGKGIPKEDREKVFELFYRPENELTRTTTGTGIGLSLVSQLLHEMGAEYQFEFPDIGTEFQMKFKVID